MLFVSSTVPVLVLVTELVVLQRGDSGTNSDGNRIGWLVVVVVAVVQRVTERKKKKTENSTPEKQGGKNKREYALLNGRKNKNTNNSPARGIAARRAEGERRRNLQ